MGRRSSEEQPAIRKSFLVTGGIAIGVAVLAFVATNFLTNSDSGGEDQATAISETVGSPAPTSAPESAEITDAPGSRSEGLVPGGRDPFTPAVVSSGEGAQVAGAIVQNSDVTVTVFSVYGGSADVQVGEDVYEGAKPGDRLASGIVMKDIDDEGCVSFDREGDAFTVCKGQRATH
jgi:hypothetical protein